MCDSWNKEMINAVEEITLQRAQKMLKDWQNTFQNKGIKSLLIQLKEPLKSACSSWYR